MSECPHRAWTGNGPQNPPDPYCRRYQKNLRRGGCEVCTAHPDYRPPREEPKRCPTCGQVME